MKTLSQYITGTYSNNPLFENVFEDDYMSLQEIYEKIGERILNDSMINEGVFGKIGGWFKKAGDKAQEWGNKADEIVKKLSDAAQKAYEETKAKAQEISEKTWENIKGVIAKTLESIENSFKECQELFKGFVSLIGEKLSAIEEKLAKALGNAIADGKEWIQNMIEDKKMMAALNSIMLALMAAKRQGITSDQIMDLMSTLGYK